MALDASLVQEEGYLVALDETLYLVALEQPLADPLLVLLLLVADNVAGNSR